MTSSAARRTRKGWRGRTGCACGRRVGFTLLELMITLAVAAIILALAVPSFNQMILNNRRAAAVNEFIGALNFARNMALTRRATVVMCRSASPNASSPTCDTSAATNWSQGWIVFVDQSPVAAGTTPTFSGTDEMLRRHETIAGGFSLKGVAGSGGDTAKWITFSSYGRSRDDGAVVVCDTRGWSTSARVLKLDATGRARSIDQADYGSNVPAVSGC